MIRRIREQFGSLLFRGEVERLYQIQQELQELEE